MLIRLKFDGKDIDAFVCDECGHVRSNVVSICSNCRCWCGRRKDSLNAVLCGVCEEAELDKIQSAFSRLCAHARCGYIRKDRIVCELKNGIDRCLSEAEKAREK